MWSRGLPVSAFYLLVFGQEQIKPETKAGLSDASMESPIGKWIVLSGAGNAPTVNTTSSLSKIVHDSATMVIPGDVGTLARSHILDTTASTVACKDLEGPTLARNYSLSLSGGPGRSAATIAGSHEQASIVDAAFAGAMAGHGAEINDFIPSAFVQPGPAIVSASLAVAETRGLSGEALLRAVVIGYEVASKVPKALGIKNLQKAGIAHHGVGSTFGSAAAAASLLGLSTEKISHMLSYCSQQASGS